jgi:hypothetical protein
VKNAVRVVYECPRPRDNARATERAGDEHTLPFAVCSTELPSRSGECVTTNWRTRSLGHGVVTIKIPMLLRQDHSGELTVRAVGAGHHQVLRERNVCVITTSSAW